jgi:hypothetical protein
MDNRPRHDEYREELARRGLPGAYVERLVAELDDHFTDVLEERSTSMGAARKLQPEADDAISRNAEQRLGEPRQLAIFAAEQYHARSFWGRHPWLTYLVMPLPLLIVSAITFSTALIAAGHALSFICVQVFGLEEPANPADYVMLQGIALGITCWYMLVVPPLVSGLVLCRIYRRNALDWRWPVVGCAILSLACAFLTISYRIATEPGNGMFTIGFYAAASLKWFLTSLLPKFALAMGIGLLLIKRAQQRMTLNPVGLVH